MDLRPIGVFDSGVGGLSVLDALANVLPGEQFVYVGDTAHMPYGEKSPEEISRLAKGIVQHLVETQHAKMLVVACNTSAGILAEYWDSECPVLAIEPVKPITQALSNSKQYKNIGLLATQATVSSGRYQAGLAAAKINVVPIACTGFAKLVEDNNVDTAAGRALLKTFLETLAAQNVDAIIFGCTHYPFAKAVLAELWEELAPKQPVAWLDPANWMATEALKHLKPSPHSKTPIRYQVTGNPDAFDSTAKQLGLKHIQLNPSEAINLSLSKIS